MRKRLLATAAAVLLTATLGSAAPITEPPECVLAGRWVRAHADDLPTTLAAVSRFSPTYRRAIHNALPREARVSLWREHLESFLVPGSGLSEVQRAAVRDVIARLPALHAESADPAEREALTARLTTLFPRDLGARVFTKLGPPAAARAANARPLCDCDPFVERKNSFSECDGTCTTSLCSTTPTGCGLAGTGPCHGFCR